MKKRQLTLLIFLVALLFASCKKDEPVIPPPSEVGTIYPNKIYKTVAGTQQALDIYMPTNGDKKNIPVIIYFHGGMWAFNDKNDLNKTYQAKVTTKLREEGFAVVSCDFRQLTQNIEFPINIEDCKDAVRYIRKNAPVYDINPNTIGVWGSSSGGHLALMVANANDTLYSSAFDGVSAKVSYVIDYFAPTDLPDYFEIANQEEFNTLQTTDPDTYTEEVNNVFNFFGVNPSTSDANFFKAQEMTTENSPVTHVHSASPPLLILHGEADLIVPISQSDVLEAKYKAAGADYQYFKYPGATHSFIQISDEQMNDVISKTVDFAKKHSK